MPDNKQADQSTQQPTQQPTQQQNTEAAQQGAARRAQLQRDQQKQREQRRQAQDQARERAEKDDGSLGDGMAQPGSTPAGGTSAVPIPQGPPREEDMAAPGSAGGVNAGIPDLVGHHKRIDEQLKAGEAMNKQARQD